MALPWFAGRWIGLASEVESLRPEFGQDLRDHPALHNLGGSHGALHDCSGFPKRTAAKRQDTSLQC